MVEVAEGDGLAGAFLAPEDERQRAREAGGVHAPGNVRVDLLS